MVPEAFALVVKFGSMSARVGITPAGGTTASPGVERSSVPATVDQGVVFSSKVVSLNSGSLVTDVVPETVEKSANHGVVNLEKAVVYLCVAASAVITASAVVVASLSVDASGGMIILVVVVECSVLEVFSCIADVIKVWSGP